MLCFGRRTARHGSRDGSPISGVQIEANWLGVRDSEISHLAFSAALAEVLELYFSEHFRIDITAVAPLTANR